MRLPQKIRTKIREPSQTAYDREFTPAVIKNTIDELKIKKPPGKRQSREKFIKEFTSCSLIDIHYIQSMPASRMYPQEMEERQNNPSS